MNIDKAIQIGLLPKEFSGKIKAVGNSSLTGAVQYLTTLDVKDRMEKIALHSEEIGLANDKDFNELYMANMFFAEQY
ncbi:MAG TPA: ATP-binding protein, partial [Clostridiales bacterium]|nr:ATP-binding protein [Clostridiales bacterium]